MQMSQFTVILQFECDIMSLSGWDYQNQQVENISFLSDPSPIIGNACQWLTDSLADSRLVNLIDVTLACEDAY